MTHIAAVPALALLIGAAVGVYVPLPIGGYMASAVLAWIALSVALWRRWASLVVVAAAMGFLGAGAALAADATRKALAPPILADSHPFRGDVVGAAAATPMMMTGRIRMDAVPTEFGAAFTLDLDAVQSEAGGAGTTAGAAAGARTGATAGARAGPEGAAAGARAFQDPRVAVAARVDSDEGVGAAARAPQDERVAAGARVGPDEGAGAGSREGRGEREGRGARGVQHGAREGAVDGRERATSGAVRVAVGGASAARQLLDWRAGRRVRVSATLSAPQPYRNIGTVDQEARLALAGIRLFGSVKSAAHVELLARGYWWEEAAASARDAVRRAIARHVGSPVPQSGAQAAAQAVVQSSAQGVVQAGAQAATQAVVQAAAQPAAQSAAQSAAMVTAILIGDRAGLDEAVEERLQRAGTFHVIAISGGNVAILTALVLALLRLFGLPPRTCASLTLVVVALYALVVGAGASVARAALAASVYLFARVIDHRTPAMNTLAVVVGIILVWAPLEIVDPGFWLTCLATFAIMLLTPPIAEHIRRALQRAAAALQSAATSIAFRPDLALRPDRAANGARWGRASRVLADAAIALLAATLAAEAVLLPVTAYAFSQVSIAGLLLNFAAIPLMTVVQVAGLVVVASSTWLTPLADLAGTTVDVAARALVDTARLVDVAPWSASRVAPPPLWLVLGCHASLLAAWRAHPRTWQRRGALLTWLASVSVVASAIPLPSFTLHAVGAERCRMPALPAAFVAGDPVRQGSTADASAQSQSTGVPTADISRASASSAASAASIASTASTASAAFAASAVAMKSARRVAPRWLQVTVLDVAQGDATLVRGPDGRAWLIDAGGALGRFDVGTRVVSPALWALAVRRLSTMVVTHGDLDHIGGASAVFRDFAPAEIWEGIPIEGHPMMGRLQDQASARGLRWRSVHTGDRVVLANRRADRAGGEADVRVWHPPAPEWKRSRVRNDDSIVLEITYGDISIVLPGDIGHEAERSVAHLWPRRRAICVLKVPHHGSRTSSTARLLDALAPRLAIVSAGRGNRHGHPAPDVLARYASRGITVLRTDRDGAIQLHTDGRTLVARTCAGQLLQLGPA